MKIGENFILKKKVMSKIKELLSQAYSQLDEYNKGGATQHILLWKAMGNIEDALKKLEE